jgi:hypothetical protein
VLGDGGKQANCVMRNVAQRDFTLSTIQEKKIKKNVTQHFFEGSPWRLKIRTFLHPPAGFISSALLF